MAPNTIFASITAATFGLLVWHYSEDAEGRGIRAALAGIIVGALVGAIRYFVPTMPTVLAWVVYAAGLACFAELAYAGKRLVVSWKEYAGFFVLTLCVSAFTRAAAEAIYLEHEFLYNLGGSFPLEWRLWFWPIWP